MSAATPPGAAPLTIALDLRHPQAYLALHPTRRLVTELAVRADWVPITGPALREPAPARADDDRGTAHRRHRARAIAREVETYAQAQGLVIRDFYRDPDARAVDRAWLWLRALHPERLDDLLPELFRAYWAAELDPSDAAGVAEKLDASGLDGAACRRWSEDQGEAAHEAVAAGLRTLGLAQAPSYLVEGEVFWGRQHLPMIRWILEGRRGPGPI